MSLIRFHCILRFKWQLFFTISSLLKKQIKNWKHSKFHIPQLHFLRTLPLTYESLCWLSYLKVWVDLALYTVFKTLLIFLLSLVHCLYIHRYSCDRLKKDLNWWFKFELVVGSSATPQIHQIRFLNLFVCLSKILPVERESSKLSIIYSLPHHK